MRHFLLHYAEIALKKKNRPFFEARLKENILRQMKSLGPLNVRRLPGRLLAEFPDTPDVKAVCGRLQKTFGLANFIPCILTDVSLEKLKQSLAQTLPHYTFHSFAVRAKRCEKNFPWSSQHINETIGRFVQETTGAAVNLDQPERTLYIEMFNRQIYYGFEKIPAVGGLPVGTAGRVACLLSGGIDSPVAAYRMMKRGCSVLLLHFHSAPFVPDAAIDKVLELAERLAAFHGPLRLIVIPFGEIQRHIVAQTEEASRVLLYRRMMLRIGEALTREHGAKALVTGESLSQVASQTLENLSAIGAVTSLPLLRPLIGMDKTEIIEQARAIGTYEISIRPHADCCSFMVPAHPKTRSTDEQLSRLEQDLAVDAWVIKSVKEAKVYDLEGGGDGDKNFQQF